MRVIPTGWIFPPLRALLLRLCEWERRSPAQELPPRCARHGTFHRFLPLHPTRRAARTSLHPRIGRYRLEGHAQKRPPGAKSRGRKPRLRRKCRVDPGARPAKSGKSPRKRMLTVDSEFVNSPVRSPRFLDHRLGRSGRFAQRTALGAVVPVRSDVARGQHQTLQLLFTTTPISAPRSGHQECPEISASSVSSVVKKERDLREAIRACPFRIWRSWV